MNDHVVEAAADMFRALAEDSRTNDVDEKDYALFVGNPKHHDGTKGSFVFIDKTIVDRFMLTSIDVKPEELVQSNIGKIVTATDRGLVFTFVSKHDKALRISSIMYESGDLKSLFGADGVTLFTRSIEGATSLDVADHQACIVKLRELLLTTKEVEAVSIDWKQSVRTFGKPGTTFRTRGGGVA